MLGILSPGSVAQKCAWGNKEAVGFAGRNGILPDHRYAVLHAVSVSGMREIFHAGSRLRLRKKPIVARYGLKAKAITKKNIPETPFLSGYCCQKEREFIVSHADFLLV